MENDLDNIPFTFYGDLLGVSSYFRISEAHASQKLNDFYNETFSAFSELARTHVDTIRIFLFSDSIFITGSILSTTLEHLGYLYSILFQKNLLLRGAVVEGKLDFDPRLELSNLTKQLPRGDILYRAVDLEKRNKGARIAIEKKLAQKILPREWYTIEGYLNYLHLYQIPVDCIKRKIRMTPSWGAYEYLWPITKEIEFQGKRVKFYYSEYMKKIKDLKRIVPEEAKFNIQETKKMFDSIKWELHEFYSLAKSARSNEFNKNG